MSTYYPKGIPDDVYWGDLANLTEAEMHDPKIISCLQKIYRFEHGIHVKKKKPRAKKLRKIKKPTTDDKILDKAIQLAKKEQWLENERKLNEVMKIVTNLLPLMIPGAIISKK